LAGPGGGHCYRAPETCIKDRVALDKLKADQKFGSDALKVDATPTSLINGEAHSRDVVRGTGSEDPIAA